MLLFSLVSCEDDLRLENDDTDLIEKISSAIKTRYKQDISLKELTNFEWDKVCIFTAYSSADTINANLGFEWELSELAHNRLFSEQYFLLIFTKKGKVVKYLFSLEIPCMFDLSASCYSKDNAVFKIKKLEVDGSPWYNIIDK
jgi:hypothetical protein